MKHDQPQPETTDMLAVIKLIEDAGFAWAVGRNASSYSAAVEPHPCSYIGDYISGPGCEDGDTPADALLAAAKHRGIVQ